MNEIIIIGHQVEVKLELLKQVSEKEDWNTYYIDENTGEKWIKEYPNSEYHGGGAPQLRKIEQFPWEL